MVKKVAIMGSCITRDNFNSIFNKNYKMFFECVLHQHQTSILSLMSEPIPFIKNETINNMNNFAQFHIRTEYTKEFISLFKERNPDYLLIDFYGDVYCGVVDLGSGNYFTNNDKFADLSIIKQNKHLHLDGNLEEYFSIWKYRVEALFNFIKKETPNCKVILVKSRFEDNFKNGKSLTKIRKESKIPCIDVQSMNKLWDMLDNFVISNFNVKVIDMTEKRYFLNDSHPWGSFYVHFTMDFYQDFFSKLQKYMIDNIQQEVIEAKNEINKLKYKILKLNGDNNKLKKKVNFYLTESFNHVIKRYLLKINSVRRLNMIRKSNHFKH